MNDFSQPGVERFLNGVFDVKVTSPVAPSEYGFPYYLSDESCPNPIFLNLREDKQIDFDYRQDNGHIMSIDFWEILCEFHLHGCFSKDIVFYVNGHVKQTDKKYKYVFFSSSNFIDYQKSSILEVTRGSSIPENLFFTADSLSYDAFQLTSKVIIGLRLVINEKVKEKLLQENFSGVKIVSLDSAVEHYCKDFSFEPSRIIKRKKRFLP
ncbi:Imm43 family immunity protein [Trabulsiella odontotermitis]|uniref:Imm43 family immunity protein n=1 Tax=Trabulsiella odontotermitis TaxID=379893 RepID=UPI003ACE3717